MPLKDKDIWLDATPLIHGERAVKRNSRNLVAALVRRRPEAYGLVYFDWRGNTPGRLKAPVRDKVCRWPIKTLLPAWRTLGTPRFERLVGKAKLLYATDLYFPPLGQGKVLTTIRGIAYIKSGQLITAGDRRRLLRAFGYACRRADYFLAVSESTRRDLLECTEIQENRIFVVNHGVDGCFRPMAKEAARRAVCSRFNLARPYLLFVGAVALHKNVVGLAAAFARIAAKEELDLVLAGPLEIPGREVLQKAGAEELAHRIHFLGPVSQDGPELNCLYSACEMFVFPSFYEGWCAPPLEAMACGAPVVCSDIPAVKEVVGEAGDYFNPCQVDSMAERIRFLLRDSRRRSQLVRSGFEHVAQHSWDRAAERLENVFTEILQNA